MKTLKNPLSFTLPIVAKPTTGLPSYLVGVIFYENKNNWKRLRKDVKGYTAIPAS